MKVNVTEIIGDWDFGYVLDRHILHSEYMGKNQYGHDEYKNTRSEVGEALYQFKYKSDMTRLDPLTDTLAKNFRNEIQTASFIIPMPPSKHRQKQPVELLADKLSEKLKIPVFKDILLKNKNTPQLKDIDDRAERMKILDDCFYINDSITNEGSWDVLLLDDLYSSGASLSAASRKLREYKKINKIFAVALTRTK